MKIPPVSDRLYLASAIFLVMAALAIQSCDSELPAPGTASTATPVPPTSSPVPTRAPLPSPTTPPTTILSSTETPAPTASATPTVDPTPTQAPAPAVPPTPTPTEATHTPTAVALLPEDPTPPDVLGYAAAGQIPAPAPLGLDGWINSEPLTVEDLRGKIVLLDFWTYTCVNCIRTLPYLKDWHDKYADEGLLIIGVHTPEFEFEKLPENVKMATANLGIEYPVAQDNNRVTFSIYRVQAWPTKYIMDGTGFVRYYHRGEGAYADTEEVIRFLLEERGRDLSHIEPNSDPDPQRIAGTRATDAEKFITRELYGGTRRNIDFGGAYIVNEEYYDSAGEIREYTDPGERKNHFIFLQGSWLSESENLRHARTTDDYEDYLGMKFYANEVNAVLDVEPGSEYQFRITLDGAPIPQDSAGADIAYDQNGDSIVVVDSPRMYRLVRQEEVSAHELLLMPKDDSFSLFSFTFGAYPMDDE